jgi:hypothetical protein
MSDEYQIEIPASFYALYMVEGRIKPMATRAVISARYELCEDMAQQLVEYGKNTHFDLGISEDVVLARCHRGLQSIDSGMSPQEATWVIRRLAELLAWKCPAFAVDG